MAGGIKAVDGKTHDALIRASLVRWKGYNIRDLLSRTRMSDEQCFFKLLYADQQTPRLPVHSRYSCTSEQNELNYNSCAAARPPLSAQHVSYQPEILNVDHGSLRGPSE